ncbi:MAG: YpdA family putative bacillithiol disulfide reductase, partial [Bacteroidota bacterium]
MFDLIVVGAGPSGLSCAIEGQKAGLSTLVLEKGSLVDYIRRFPTNLIWFSTPDLLEVGGVPFATSTLRPTRVDTLNYYRKVVSAYDLHIRYYDKVVAIERKGEEFHLATEKGNAFRSRFVAVATGYFDHPGRLGIPGEDLPQVSHYYTEPFAFFDCDVAVVGGRNSAVEAALDLFRHGARVTLIHRGEKLSDGVKYWVLPDIENRIKAHQVSALFGSAVNRVEDGMIVVQTPEGVRELANDHLFVLIGFEPDSDQLRRFGVELDGDSLSPRIKGESYETNVPGLFVAGSVVAGKNTNRIFVENGRLHGHDIVKTILG